MSGQCATVSDDKEVKVSKKKSTYVCSRCGNRITILITPVHAPTCSNHTGGGVAMKLVEDQ
jgi:hypothetical protein